MEQPRLNLTKPAATTRPMEHSLSLAIPLGSENTAIGAEALKDNTTGVDNTATGFRALMSNTGVENTANGSSALQSNTIGEGNTAVGSQALSLNTQGSGNTATGSSALFGNTTGDFNTASGDEALFANTTGTQNTATGSAALTSNTSGFGNTATGFQALLNNSTGNFNTATGIFALQSNTTGDINVATGQQALNHNTTGDENVAVGASALFNNIAGTDNIAIGFGALLNNTGSGNVALGTLAGSNLTTGNSNIVIGNLLGGVAGEANTMRIGLSQFRTFISGIRGVTTGNANAIPVMIDSDGQLGTMSSARRFKHEIKPMDTASQAILSLKPVTFNYKSDNTNTPQFGLIAEEVAQVSPDLVVRDDKGDIYTVRYDAVNAMLLNEFLNEHRTVNELRAIVAQQQKQLEALTAGLQKVSAQLELNKAAPQTVLNDN